MLDPEVDGYLNYSILAAVGRFIGVIFAPLGFGGWEATAMTLTGLIAKENVVSTFATLYSLGDLGEGDAAMWAAFAQMVPTAGAMMAFAAFNLLCAPCFAAIGTIRKQMNSPKWFWFAIGYECVFAWVVALLINQFYRWFALGLFGPWTVVALILLALMLFQLFRPAPKR